jgi:hypothetical protein
MSDISFGALKNVTYKTFMEYLLKLNEKISINIIGKLNHMSKTWTDVLIMTSVLHETENSLGLLSRTHYDIVRVISGEEYKLYGSFLCIFFSSCPFFFLESDIFFIILYLSALNIHSFLKSDIFGPTIKALNYSNSRKKKLYFFYCLHPIA